MISNKWYGMELSEAEQQLADYYHDCTNCHAYDEGGRLHGKMVIEITYNTRVRDKIQVLSSDVVKDVYDPLDE